MSHAELLTQLGKLSGSKRGAVVGQHPAHGNVQLPKVFHGGSQEGCGTAALLTRFDLSKSHARMVIDRHEQVFPTSTIDRVASIARDAMAHPLDASELLGVDMNQITRVL